MANLIIVALAAFGALVAWVWFRRRSVPEKKLADDRRSDQEPLPEEAEASQRTGTRMDGPGTTDERQGRSAEGLDEATDASSSPVQTHQAVPALSEIVEPAGAPPNAVEVRSSSAQPPPVVEPVHAVSGEPVVPARTLAEGASPATNESTTREQAAAALEPEQAQPSSAVPPSSGLSIEEVSAPSNASSGEGFDMEAKAPASLPGGATGVVEPRTQTTIPHEKFGEAEAPPDKPVANSCSASQAPSGEAQPELTENRDTSLAETESAPKPHIYKPPKPPAPPKKSSRGRERSSNPAAAEEAELRVRLKLKFGRGTMSLALVPYLRAGMPDELDITGTQGELRLVKSSGRYEDVPVGDASTVLRQGVAWRGHGDARRWRWAMGGRELYVLTSGDVGGL
jgi:hypothetical protein